MDCWRQWKVGSIRSTAVASPLYNTDARASLRNVAVELLNRFYDHRIDANRFGYLKSKVDLLVMKYLPHLPKEVCDNAFYFLAMYTYKTFKQTTGTLIPLV